MAVLYVFLPRNAGPRLIGVPSLGPGTVWAAVLQRLNQGGAGPWGWLRPPLSTPQSQAFPFRGFSSKAQLMAALLYVPGRVSPQAGLCFPLQPIRQVLHLSSSLSLSLSSCGQSQKPQDGGRVGNIVKGTDGLPPPQPHPGLMSSEPLPDL